MRIAIDTDGVLTDMSGYFMEIGKKLLNREPTNLFAYNIEEMYSVSKSEKIRYGLYLFVNYCKNCPPRSGTARVLKQLHKDGHELHEVTARKFVTMKNPVGSYSRKMLMDWYKKHELEFDSIVFCSEKNTSIEKSKACKDLGIGVMVEDRPEIASCLSQNGINVLLFDAPYNQELHGEKIIRCYTWDDVYHHLQILSNE